MTPERWTQIEQIYHAALECEAEQRAGFLDKACGVDQALRREVESLLAFESESDHFAAPGDVAAEMLTDEPRQSAVGQRLGCYNIVSLLGRGGMGEVYLAQDANLGRNVALKLLSQALTSDPKQVERFKQEARAASALNHPNISTIFEIGEVDGVYFIAMEFIDGETLRQHMANNRMTVSEALDVTLQAARALEASHRSGIVHRDIKPENIMLRPDGYVKILDFGLAKLVERRADSKGSQAPTVVVVKTTAGMVMGTPSYMSPEQARGLAVDTRTDIFSLGVLIYEMLTGSPPFEGNSAMDVIVSLLEREPQPLTRFAEDSPAELQRIVTRSLRKDREKRYQTITEMLFDLTNLREKLQFEARLENSVSRGTAGGTESTRYNNRAVEAATEKGALGGRVTTTNTISIAEYPASGITRRKLGAALAGVALAAVVAGLVYFLFFFASKGGGPAVSSVAVLPFTNESHDLNTEYLSDGISESLINSLSRLPELKIIARSSSFKYKGQEADPQEVAKALGVLAIVTGRVVQRGDRLQVSAELVDARDKTQMWGERYDRKAADLQSVQEEIAQAISEKLRLRLTRGQGEQLRKHATEDSQAYQLYLAAGYYAKGENEDQERALNYLNQAVALDPGFAQAYVRIATVYTNLMVTGVLDPKEAAPKAKAAAQKALALDESLAEAHATLALINNDEWDWQAVDSQLRRALELNPNLARAHMVYSFYLTSQGRHEQAIAEMKRAKELDPLAEPNIDVNLGYALYFARQYDEAIEQLTRTLNRYPNFSFGSAILGYTYAAKGMYPEAVAEYQKTVKLRNSSSDQCFLGYALGKAGRRRNAEAILNGLLKSKEYVSPGELAILYCGLGQKEQALASLERGFAAHDLQMQYLKVEPHYDSLRSDPRFTDVMRKVGLR